MRREDERRVGGSVRMLGRTLGALSRRQRLAIGAGTAAMLGASALAAVFPVLAGSLIDQAVGGRAAVSLTGAMDELMVIVGVVLLQQVLTVVRRQLVENAATTYERDQRTAAYEKLIRLDLGEVRDDQIGRLLGGGNRAAEGAVKLLKLAGLDLVPAVTLAVCAIIVAFTRNEVVALVMLGVLPTGLAIVWAQIRNQRGVRIDIRDTKSDIDGGMTEILYSLDAVRASGAEEHFAGGVREICDRLRRREYDHHRAMALWDAVKAGNEGLWLCAVLATAITLAAGGDMTIGEITSYLLLFASVLTPIRELHRILDEWSESTTQAVDHFALLDTPDDVSYAPVAVSAPARAHVREVAPAVRVRDVRFRYAPGERAVLDGLDLDIAHGERIGIVGRNGCGKSTLLRLLTRLAHDYEGEIELSGVPLEQLDRAALAGFVGYVPQQAQLFRATIAENIGLGHPGIGPAEIEAAAVLASVDTFVRRLPDGYDTMVAERATNLSGGQQQRLCLARALVRRPRILLLDEPTSALDAASERQVTAAVEALDGVTVVSVAHRLQTLRGCDRVVVLDSGRVAQSGTYGELASTDGLFAELLRQGGKRRRAA